MSVQEEAAQFLYQIETQVRDLVNQKRVATEIFLKGFIPENILELLEEEDSLRSKDFEHFHLEWESMIPESPEFRAAFAKCFSETYPLVKQWMPSIWKILGFEEEQVQEAFSEQYGESMESIITPASAYVPKVSELSQWMEETDLNPLKEFLTRVVLSDGDVLFRKGDSGDKVYALTRGRINVILEIDNRAEPIIIQKEPFDLIGELALLTGAPRNATVAADGECELWYVSTDILMKLMEHYPHVFEQVFEIASERYHYNYFSDHMRSFFGDLELGVIDELFQGSEQIHLERGEYLFEKGTRCQGWYLITTGRLGDDAAPTHTTYEQGDSLGEEALLFNKRHQFSLVALCDTELIKLSPDAFDRICSDPVLIRRMFEISVEKRTINAATHQKETAQVIAIGALTSDESATYAIERMMMLNADKKDFFFLNPQILKKTLNIPDRSLYDTNHLAWMRIRSWYTQEIARHRNVVLIFDTTYPAWDNFCNSSADTLVGVVDATKQPNRLPHVAWFERTDARLPQKRWLVLVHPQSVEIPSGTTRWLARFAKPQHVHISGTGDAELGRVMRMVSGTAFGIVLGGGSARGLAHIGVLRAMEELGIPVDMISGTSMGALMGALIAKRMTFDGVRELTQWLIELDPFHDFTIPRTSLLRSRKIEQMAHSVFENMGIEDLWLNYFAISTNLTTAEEIIHESGKVWEATMASGALPVMLPPFIKDDEVLVDGGLLNNLPADRMRQRTNGAVIAINVSPLEEWELKAINQPQETGSLFDKFKSRFSLQGNPGIFEIMTQSMVVSSHQRLISTVSDVDLLLEPPVAQFGMTEFTAVDEIMRLAYEYAYPLLLDFKHNHEKMKSF